MAAFFALFLLAVAVKPGGAPLREGCSADADVIAKLDSGAPITIRYAVSGEDIPCYKVSAQSDGKTVEGFLPASAITGLDEFEKGLKDAAWLDATQMLGALRASSQQMASFTGGNGSTAALANQAAALIEASQPSKALQLLEPAIKTKRDATLLALAGVAAWRSDDPRGALTYWKGSLDIQPNPDLERLYKRVEREANSDQSSEKLFGLRVLLRYDSAVVPQDSARQMVATLDEEFSRISGEVGCVAEERIVAIVQSREAYRKSTDSAEWNGGQFDGRIRVPILGQGVDAQIRRTFAHEITHACLSMLGRWPAWLQEGLAQKMSGDSLTPSLRQKLSAMAREGRLPRLENLRQDWSRMDAEHATAAYALSLAAVELFYENYAGFGVRNLVKNPQRLTEITADLDKRLGLQ